MMIDSENTNVGLRHLQAAVTIRDEGSFVRAAEVLNVAPSALTETIRQLESFAGLPLFDRATRPVSPTVEAVGFINEAAELLLRFDRIMTDLRRFGSLQRGFVRVGLAPSLVLHLLSPALAAFRAEHPQIEIEIHDDSVDKMAEMVRDSIIDLGIVARGQSDPTLEEELLFSDRFGLVCHRDHPLARHSGPITFDDLDPAHIISLKPHTGISRLLKQYPNLPDCLQSGMVQTNSTISLLTLVSRNNGIALMPQLAMDVIQSGNLVFRDIEGFDLKHSFFVLSRRRGQTTAAAARFLFHLRQALQNLANLPVDLPR
ncbi:DNA-binding transcriptional LysR family regulator [Chelatococcus asaccharovorans]|nr:DNA-binding transcriptional LysR family regulator [Chelatococcus asaccharovorans]CAH1683717.1 DNA-binding transcriptional LysR family regulator [Chelatococcus asaccharovorans]